MDWMFVVLCGPWTGCLVCCMGHGLDVWCAVWAMDWMLGVLCEPWTGCLVCCVGHGLDSRNGGTLGGHELWNLQFSPLDRPEEGIEKRGRNVENFKILSFRLRPP
jgi:hypothetical protein